MGLSYQDQIEIKVNEVNKVLTELKIQSEINFVEIGNQDAGSQFGQRNRMDFVFEQGQFGLYSHQRKQIIDLDTCGQLNADLLRFYKEFRHINWPIKKGSFRLRTGPNSNFGAWLDFSNLDIKKLLDEKTHLQELMKFSFVEIGQRAKSLVVQDNHLKLSEPKLQTWFSTRYKEDIVDLQCYVSSFTQPSIAANLKLANLIQTHYRGQKYKSAIEFGCGIGNLSFVFLEFVDHLKVFEFDENALHAFSENLKNHQLSDRVQIHSGDFQRQVSINNSAAELLILNPPRSGLGHFLNSIMGFDKMPQSIFLMSCFLDSWQKDSQYLIDKNYKLDKVILLDQFPQTKHFEILSFWQLQ